MASKSSQASLVQLFHVLLLGQMLFSYCWFFYSFFLLIFWYRYSFLLWFFFLIFTSVHWWFLVGFNLGHRISIFGCTYSAFNFIIFEINILWHKRTWFDFLKNDFNHVCHAQDWTVQNAISLYLSNDIGILTSAGF